MPTPPRLPISHDEDVETGRAHILNRNNRASLHGFNAGFEEEFFKERVAHLDVGPLLFRFLREFGARHGRAVDAIASRLCSDIDYRITNAGRSLRRTLRFPGKHREASDIDERVAGVTFFEDALATDSWDAETVTVVRDSADDTAQNSLIVRGSAGVPAGRPETQRIHNGKRARAHGENIAQDAANARCRSLERLNVTGVIVRFDLESDHPAPADADNAGIFARTLNNIFSLRGEFFQMNAGVLI